MYFFWNILYLVKGSIGGGKDCEWPLARQGVSQARRGDGGQQGRELRRLDVDTWIDR